MADLGELMQACRDKFGDPPRELAGKDASDFRLRPAFLMRLVFLLTRDKLRTVLREQNLLRDHGRVVWGTLVQANNALFDPSNRMMLPANVIYSPDKFYDDEAEMLRGLAQGLFSLKGTSPRERDLQRFAAAITDELARTMRLPLPKSVSDDRDVYFTTCLIQPSHLPGGYLASGIFPLVICPKKTEAVMILPAKYWPRELRERWKDGDL